MATFTAYAAADFTGLDIYKNIRSAVFFPDAADNGAGGFRAQFAPTSWVQIKGFGFAYVATPSGLIPYTGTTTSTFTYLDGTLAYTLTGISITQEQAGQYITMPPAEVANAVFGGADTIIGSKFADTLDGFGGGDTMKGGAATTPTMSIRKPTRWSSWWAAAPWTPSWPKSATPCRPSRKSRR